MGHVYINICINATGLPDTDSRPLTARHSPRFMQNQ